MKNQSWTIKTNLELYRVVMGGSGGYRRLPGGSDDFSLQTNTQTDTHHNIYIIIIFIFIIIIKISWADRQLGGQTTQEDEQPDARRQWSSDDQIEL